MENGGRSGGERGEVGTQEASGQPEIACDHGADDVHPRDLGLQGLVSEDDVRVGGNQPALVADLVAKSNVVEPAALRVRELTFRRRIALR